MSRCATAKKISKKNIFLACGVVFSRKLTSCLSPYDFSKRLKIWNFGKNKKSCASMCRCATEKKISQKVIFLASGDFFMIVNDEFTQYYMYQEANGIFMVYIYSWYISGSFPALFWMQCLVYHSVKLIIYRQFSNYDYTEIIDHLNIWWRRF